MNTAQGLDKIFRPKSISVIGATSRPGHAIWPNEKDNQRVPKNASLAGDHAVSGEGVPPSLRFALGERQDFMERLNLAAPGDPKASINSSWNAVPHARAYFLSAMGGDGNDMILWSSSDVPEAGLGLMDYLSHSQIDQWVRDKVLLPATTQQCAIPSGIFATAGGAMLRGIAYGNELNLVHPPRPTDPKLLAAWNPEWSLRVRVKSTAMAMLGQEAQPERQQQQQQRKEEPVNPLDILKKGYTLVWKDGGLRLARRIEDVAAGETVLVSYFKGEFSARVESVDRTKLLESRFLKEGS